MRTRSFRDVALVAEAALWLGWARIVLVAVPFARLAERLELPSEATATVNPAQTAARVGRAVRAAARRVPFRAVCFPQALAARAMLHRRGIPVTLFYGVANDADALKAHVWVRASDIDVIGTEIADQHTLVATFPKLNG